VFIPALDHAKLKEQVAEAASDKGMVLKGYARIEGKKYGVRFWRLV
jgi:hypothetical protein